MYLMYYYYYFPIKLYYLSKKKIQNMMEPRIFLKWKEWTLSFSWMEVEEGTEHEKCSFPSLPTCRGGILCNGYMHHRCQMHEGLKYVGLTYI